jgi:hypothetical protein
MQQLILYQAAVLVGTVSEYSRRVNRRSSDEARWSVPPLPRVGILKASGAPAAAGYNNTATLIRMTPSRKGLIRERTIHYFSLLRLVPAPRTCANCLESARDVNRNLILTLGITFPVSSSHFSFCVLLIVHVFSCKSSPRSSGVIMKDSAFFCLPV